MNSVSTFHFVSVSVVFSLACLVLSYYLCIFLSATARGQTPSTSSDSKAQNDIFIQITPFTYNFSECTTLTKPAPHLDVSMILDGGYAAIFPYALSIPLEQDGVKLPAFEKNPIFAYDDEGELPMKMGINDLARPPRREWLLQRKPSGIVKFRMRIAARDSHDADPRGFTLLRYNEGAFTGALKTFIPQPPSYQSWDWSLTFDMRNMSSNELAVWTYGEYHPALRPILTAKGTPAELFDSILAVGKLNKYPPGPDSPVSFSAYSPTSHKLPDDLTLWTEELSSKMSFFFHDLSPAYRLIFVRNPYPGGSGMHAFTKSLMLSFTGTSDPPADVTAELIARNLVSTWPQLVEFPPNTRTSARWFNDGIALYYSALLPYTFKMSDLASTLTLLNRHATAYYTSKAIRTPNDALSSLPPSDETLRTHAAFRGFMYFIATAHALRANASAPSLDELMWKIVANKRVGLHDHAQTWKNTLALYLGQTGWDAFENMMRGAFIKPAVESLAYLGLSMRRNDRFGFELGFDEACLDGQERAVRGLAKGSRAEKGGVRDGDVVLGHRSTTYRPVSEDYEAKIVLTARRGEKVLELEYWPRSWEQVEAYEWVREEDGYESVRELEQAVLQT